ncbi:MAG: YbaB/EbfC family nucleoid-associated protein [Clostridiales bacterium]|jgi:DNA-binding YbaB/EbfC family protein|nr:YbaB/EbfC family nucleoid-associated protein [Clostridiales bacterium]
MPKFGGFGGGNNMQQLMKQAQKMQEDMQKAQEELEDTEISAEAGGGLVEVTMTGKKQLISIKIKPEVVDPSDVEMLEDLIIAAINDAYKTADEEAERVMGPLAGGMGGLF